jgi:predicted  nucleic acid-binding Zn-ribbon protein
VTTADHLEARAATAEQALAEARQRLTAMHRRAQQAEAKVAGLEAKVLELEGTVKVRDEVLDQYRRHATPSIDKDPGAR